MVSRSPLVLNSKKLENTMNILYTLLLCITSFTIADNIELTISGAQQSQMPITIMVLDENNNELNTIAHIIAQDLKFTGQFNPSIKKYSPTLSNKDLGTEIKQLAYAGIPLALCISGKSSK